MTVPHIFIHWSDEHLVCFQFLLIMNNAAIGICIMSLCTCVFISLGKNLGMGFLGHMVHVCLYVKLPISFPKKRF